MLRDFLQGRVFGIGEQGNLEISEGNFHHMKGRG